MVWVTLSKKRVKAETSISRIAACIREPKLVADSPGFFWVGRLVNLKELRLWLDEQIDSGNREDPNGRRIWEFLSICLESHLDEGELWRVQFSVELWIYLQLLPVALF